MTTLQTVHFILSVGRSSIWLTVIYLVYAESISTTSVSILWYLANYQLERLLFWSSTSMNIVIRQGIAIIMTGAVAMFETFIDYDTGNAGSITGIVAWLITVLAVYSNLLMLILSVEFVQIADHSVVIAPCRYYYTATRTIVLIFLFYDTDLRACWCQVSQWTLYRRQDAFIIIIIIIVLIQVGRAVVENGFDAVVH